jgi:hypothetical protein
MISLSRTIDFTISEPDVIILNTPKSFIVKSENYTYLKFTSDSIGGNYRIITDSQELSQKAVRNGDTFQTIGWNYVNFYLFTLPPNSLCYYGIRTKAMTTNTVTITKENDITPKKLTKDFKPKNSLFEQKLRKMNIFLDKTIFFDYIKYLLINKDVIV